MTVKSEGSPQTTTTLLACRVYLAHPISSKSGSSVDEWVRLVRKTKGMTFIDPESYGLKDDENYDEIVRRNILDIAGSDVVAAYAETPSAGVSMEILTASNIGRPVITFTGKNDRVSAWVRFYSVATYPGINEFIQHLGNLSLIFASRR